MSEPSRLTYIPGSLLDATGRLLASFAADRPSEGVVYWFGLETPAHAVVTSLVVPDADTEHGNVVTSAAVNAEALSAIVGTPLVLIGQAHSHPGSYVRHSRTDDRETFAQFPGALSVVVPHFARSRIELERCGVHRHLGGRYVRIPTKEVSRHLRLLPGIVDFRRGDRAPKTGEREA
jgi:proteasome lid subunit RPN8/RPN11